ncbi:hypothetical protein F5X96DRAFT_669960 [Biscogniauxia mediterranea]|nr:hypothetical protein F5X96DRAFT_669960 [Biscogniauxia mediterranea]
MSTSTTNAAAATPAATASPAAIAAANANMANAAAVGTPTVPASSRIHGVAWHHNGKDFFQCREPNPKKPNGICMAVFKNTAHSISSHATKIHVHDSMYQHDSKKSNKFHCPLCYGVTRGFNAYVKHWRDHHPRQYKGSRPLRFHQR